MFSPHRCDFGLTLHPHTWAAFETGSCARFALFSDYGSLLQAMDDLSPVVHSLDIRRPRPPVRPPSLPPFLPHSIGITLVSTQDGRASLPRSLTLASIQVKLSRWMCMWRRRRGRWGREGGAYLGEPNGSSLPCSLARSLARSSRQRCYVVARSNALPLTRAPRPSRRLLGSLDDENLPSFSARFSAPLLGAWQR